jgi:hypothetical protein
MISQECRLNQRFQEVCIQCRLHEAQQEAQTVKKQESSPRSESDAIVGDLKRLSAKHRETKEMLAERQSEVAQLTMLKTQIENQVAAFNSKLTSTEKELCKTQNVLATRAQELADS